MAKKKAAKKLDTRQSYYKRQGQSVIQVGLTDEERAEIEDAMQEGGASSRALFIKQMALNWVRKHKKK